MVKNNLNHFERARSSILMPYNFVGFDICHQSYSPPLPSFASSGSMVETPIKKRAILQNIAKWHGAL